MAQKVNIILVDDLDESEATETVAFGLDGTSYEIDLNDGHAGELRTALAAFIGHARKVPSSSRRVARRAASAVSSATGASAAEVRIWARENGHSVPERGRIPAEIREAYDAAH
ncbi:Lsr2 family protein [soil metagenome]